MKRTTIFLTYIFVIVLGLATESFAERIPSCKCSDNQIYFYDSLNKVAYCGDFPVLVNSRVKHNGRIAKCHNRFYRYRTPYGPMQTSDYGYIQTVCKDDRGRTYYDEQTAYEIKNPEIDKNSINLYRGKMKLETKKGQVYYINIDAYCPVGYGYIPISNMCSSGLKPKCR